MENERFEKFQAILTEQNEYIKKALEQCDEFLKIMKKYFISETQKNLRKGGILPSQTNCKVYNNVADN